MSVQAEHAEDVAEDTITVGTDADGNDYRLPIEDVLTGRLFVTGKSGSGKSNSASVIAEGLLERGHPLLIVDVDGEYWGLKESHEILHVGATEECELQVGPEHGDKLAELAIEQGVPIILDVSEYIDSDEADAIVRETVQSVFAREKDARMPFLLIVEEIHEYIPQQGGRSEVGDVLVRVAKRGRKRGLGICGLSQRPASVDKDVITQADMIAWHRLTWENDTDVVRKILDADHAQGVSTLADGQAFVQADWSEADVETVQFRRKKTFDAGATPGLDDVDRPELKGIGEDLLDELEQISDEHELRQDRVSELEAQLEAKDEEIAELENEIERLKTADETLDLMMNRLQGAGVEGGVPEGVQDQLAEKNETIADLRSEVSDRGERIEELEEESERLAAERERLKGLAERIDQAERIEEQLDRAREVLGVDVTDSKAATAAVGADVEAKEERVAELEAQTERLRERLEDAGGVSVPTDYQDFVNDDVVQEALEDAKKADHVSPRYVRGVVAGILQEGGPIDYEEIAEMLAVSDTSNIGKAATALENRGVVKKVDNRPVTVDFDLEGLAKIKEKNLRRREAERVMEDL